MGKKQLIRPLLKLNRLEILKLCVFWKLPISIDATNQYLIFKRNRLRHQILPILKFFFNPKVEKALLKFIEIINFENYYFRCQFYEIQRFLKTQYFSYEYLNNKFVINWISYLPFCLQQRFCKQFLLFYFQSISFFEIDFLLKNISNFK